ncbi:MAG: LuxR C-terminal-related transcriptional regulator [Hyphomicrobiales bacterium]
MEIKNYTLSIVDNDSLFGDLLKSYFNNQTDIFTCHSYHNEDKFIDDLRSGKEKPDVVILEMKLNNYLIEKMMELLNSEFPNIRVIVLTSYYKRVFIGSIFRMGVKAFIPKSVYPSELKDIILEVKKNGCFIYPKQLQILKDQISIKAPKPIFNETDKLTSREIEVLDLICQQKTTNDIAEKLFITKRTVEGHRSNLLLKTRTKNTVGLVIWAMQNKIVNLDSYMVCL